MEFHYIKWKASEKIWKNYTKPEKGWITVPERPELGLKPNDKAISEYTVE